MPAITLTKENGPADLTGVTHLDMGLAWDTSTGGSGGIVGKLKQRLGSDLDAIGILMQGDKPVQYVGLDNLDPCENGSILHSGDETRGNASGDDETVTMRFADVPQDITAVLLVATAYKLGSDMKRAKNIKVTLYDSTGGSKDAVAVIKPSLLSTKNVMAIARVDRRTDGAGAWSLSVVDGEYSIKQGEMDQLLKGAINYLRT